MKYLLTGEVTERLRFRMPEDNDVNIWQKFFYQKDVARFLGLEHLSGPEECCKAWFEKVNDRYANDLGGMNILVDKQTNEFIGQAGLLVQELEAQNLWKLGILCYPISGIKVTQVRRP